MWKDLGDREAGKLRPYSFSNRITSDRIASLQLSNYKEIVSPHRGAVNSLQVDLTEGRYLLSGASDASAAVYDIQRATEYEGGSLVAKHKSIFVVDKQHEHGHKYAISSAIWYPIDTGLFITGSYDHYINVWDTNTTQVVVNFKMPGKIYRTAMSSLATAHMLIAAGTEDVQVRLCDIASGAFAHTLSGHRDGVMTVEWSTSSEWVLISPNHSLVDAHLSLNALLRISQGSKSRSIPVRLGRVVSALTMAGNIGVEMVEKMRGSKPTKMKNTDYRDGLHLVVAGRIPQVLAGDGTKRHDEEAESSDSSTAIIYGEQRNSFYLFVIHCDFISSNALEAPMSKSLPASQSVNVRSRAPQRKFAYGNVSNSQLLDRATSHYGAVTGLKVTDDGMYLLSAGSDSRLRLWDIMSGCNTLVNFETVRLQTSKAMQLAITNDSALVFVPCMTAVKAFDVWSGKTTMTFRGHYEYVNCCWLSLQDQELYTGGNDRQILVWSPSRLNFDEMLSELASYFVWKHMQDHGSREKHAQDQDNWSD
ncbi:DNA excision repair protein ERCC-8 [Vitis vinifera]|uniref:DNA excision repair protein ERCC-8 n=1 Tax=Vitis vinifera TaxID=29760 RepID=A0A438KN87_VITVI|nr:DNA excision repair protein ERCC-8 [Vitis vinifera]